MQGLTERGQMGRDPEVGGGKQLLPLDTRGGGRHVRALKALGHTL